MIALTTCRHRAATTPTLVACLLLVACTSDPDPGDADTDTAAETSQPVDTASSSTSTLLVEPANLDFGTIAVDGNTVRDLTLENAGVDPIQVTRIRLVTADGHFSFNRADLTLAAAEVVELKVTYLALDEGVHTDVLQLETDAVNGPLLEVPVTGRSDVGACVDADGDMHGVNCPAGSDCDDTNPDIFEGAPERCNLDDDDCDGLFDEDFVGLGAPCTAGVGLCEVEGVNVCSVDALGVTCSAEATEGGVELCNGIDDDCDGITDEDFPSKGQLCTVGVGACAKADKWSCAEDGLGLMCAVSPDASDTEVCSDGIDNDCDGQTDEGRLEVCADNIDNDCDGETDESGTRWGESFFARDWRNETVALYPANGDGTFEPPIVLDFPGDNRFSVFAVGDVDADQWLDLVVREILTEGRTLCSTNGDCGAGFTCAEGVCRKTCSNDGDCTAFQFEQCVDTRSHVINQDTYCLPPSTIYLARSSCEGENVIELTELFTVPPGDEVQSVVDVDNNGHLDFVGLHHFTTKTGFLWLNNGAGGFTKLSPAFDYTPLFGPGAVGHWQWGLLPTSRDLNGDGYIDIVGKSQGSSGAEPTDFWVLKGNGDGTFEPMVSLGAQLPLPANLATINDFDGDGDHDIVGGLDEDGQPGAGWIMRNISTADTFAFLPEYEVFDLAPSYNDGAERPGLGAGTSFDFTGDDVPDLLTAWTPEECGSFIWGCSDVQSTNDLCFGGDCRKVALLANTSGAAACGPTESCVDGVCEAGCVPNCAGLSCGDNGCGGSCGICPAGNVCSNGQCLVDCTPQCAGKQCGDDGCGGQCGSCPVGLSCLGGACSDDCTPSCAGKQCGDDGCGGTCAFFAPPVIIAFDNNPNTNLRAPSNVPPTVPTVAIDPASPTASDALSCLVTAPSYDLGTVTYAVRWFRDGIYAKDLGGAPTVPSAVTSANEIWRCDVVATDGVERSPVASSSATIGE